MNSHIKTDLVLPFLGRNSWIRVAYKEIGIVPSSKSNNVIFFVVYMVVPYENSLFENDAENARCHAEILARVNGLKCS